jgi:predicted lipid carrier protein YhbT
MENLGLIMERKADAVGIYFQGKIGVEGDLSLAFKLQSML